MTHIVLRALLASLCILWVAGCSDDAPRGATDGGAVDGGSQAPDSGGADASQDDAGAALDAAAADAGAPDATATSPGAYVSDRCGPADGPAIELLLFEAPGTEACTADETQRTLRLWMHDLGGATIPPSAGDTIVSTAAASHGTASECPGGTPPCRVSETWTLSFETYAADGDASGTYSVTWDDGSTTTGQFDAVRCETGTIRCG